MNESAIIATALDHAPESYRERFAAIGVFAADTDVPKGMIHLLFLSAYGWPEESNDQAIGRLVTAGALVPSGDGGGWLRIPAGIRAALRETAGPDGLGLASAALLDRIGPDLGPSVGVLRAPWWRLPDGAVYLRRHLCDLLTDAGRTDELAGLVTDSRWLTLRIERDGTGGALADLDLSGAPAARQVRERLAGLGDALDESNPVRRAGLVAAATGGPVAPVVVAEKRPEPPRPAPEKTRVVGPDFRPPPVLGDLPVREYAVRWRLPLTGRRRHGGTSAVAAPDGSWLAVGGCDLQVWVLHPATGRTLREIPVPSGALKGLALSADGRTLVGVATGHMNPVVVLDVASGDVRGEVRRPDFGPPMQFSGELISPDGGWFALVHGGLHVYSLDGEPIRDIDLDSVGRPTSWLASADGAGVYLHNPESLAYADIGTGEVHRLGPGSGDAGDWSATVRGPDGRWLVPGGAGAMVVTEPGGERIRGLMSPRYKLSPDGRWILSRKRYTLDVRLAGSLLRHPEHRRPGRFLAGRYQIVDEAAFDEKSTFGFADVCWLPDNESLFAVGVTDVALLTASP